MVTDDYVKYHRFDLEILKINVLLRNNGRFRVYNPTRIWYFGTSNILGTASPYYYISESEINMDSLGLLIFEPVDEIRSAHWVFGNSTGILTQTTAKVLKFDSGVVTLKKPSPPNNAEYMQAVIDFGNTVYKSPEIKV